MSTHREALKTIIETLLDESLTHLMLGHRELFHSNLLAWFFYKFKNGSNKVFWKLTERSTEGGGARAVEREGRKLDLWFQWPDHRPLVIENKVFSLPDVKQLEKYEQRIEEKSDRLKLGTASKWLLSLGNPHWPNDEAGTKDVKWRWLSYSRLAELIDEAITPDEDDADPYDVETMRRYAKVVRCLSTFAESIEVKKLGEPVALPDLKTQGARSAADSLKASMEKLRFYHIAHRISEDLHDKGFHRDVKVDYTNKAPLLDWFGSIPGEPYWQAGWQLQNDQFRLAVRAPEKVKTDKKLKRDTSESKTPNDGGISCERFATEKTPHHFDFSYLDKILNTGGQTEAMPEYENVMKLLKYGNDFRYRYKRVPGLTVDALRKAAIAVAKKVKSMPPPNK